MDKRELLKSMLHNLINDKPEEAALDFHNYITPKTREVAGLGQSASVDPDTIEIVDDPDLDPNE
jgi:hypothetical protein